MEFTDNVFGTEDFSDNLLFGLGLAWMVAKKCKQMSRCQCLKYENGF